MGEEIERKWLVHYSYLGDLRLTQYIPHNIAQGYLEVLDPETYEIRLRQKDLDFFITSKQKGENGLKRPEIDAQISESLFRGMWPFTEGRRVLKVRYDIPDGNKSLEFDEYLGDLSPLLTVEREFDFDVEARLYKPRPWFGPEVTEDKRFKNKNLARYGLPEGFEEFLRTEKLPNIKH